MFRIYTHDYRHWIGKGLPIGYIYTSKQTQLVHFALERFYIHEIIVLYMIL